MFISVCVCLCEQAESVGAISHSVIFPGKQLCPSTPFSLWAVWSLQHECDDRALFTPHCDESDVTTSNRWLCFQLCCSFHDPSPPQMFPYWPFLCSEIVWFLLTVCCGSWLPEQVVQALLSDRHLQGLWREVWSASWPRWPGISCGCPTVLTSSPWFQTYDFCWCVKCWAPSKGNDTHLGWDSSRKSS